MRFDDCSATRVLRNGFPRILYVMLAATWVLAGRTWAGTAEITGTIVDESTRLPVAGMCVEAYGLTSDEVSSAPTGIDGVYTLPGLSPDRFQLVARDCVAPVEYSLAEYRHLHGAHLSPDGARLLRIAADGTVKRNVKLRTLGAGHLAVTVVHDATDLPAVNVPVCPTAVRQRPGSLVVTGFCGFSDGTGQIALDVAPGASNVVAYDSLLTAASVVVDVAPGPVQAVELRIP
jgi:hypothetical protein